MAAAAVVHGSLGCGARGRAALALLTAGAAGAVSIGMARERVGPELARPWEGVVEGTVESARVGREGWRVDLTDTRPVADGPRSPSAGGAPPLPRRIRLRGEPAPDGAPVPGALAPGTRLRAAVRLRPPGGLRNPGLPDSGRALRRAGIGATGRLRDPSLFVRLPDRSARLALPALHRLRARLAARLEATGPGGGLLRALALGDRGGLSAADRDAFGVLGLSHLLAVSGLHLALVAAGAFAVLRRVAARLPGLAARRDARGAALAGAAGAALGFALLAGWGVPVRRALVLMLALAAGFAARRPLPALTPLALAALWILVDDPRALFAPGAQLSFAATAALVLGLRGPGRPGGGMRGREGLGASATALAVTAPLAAGHWGAQAPLALAANALAVPWTGLVLLPAALSATVCAAVAPGPVPGLVSAGAERVAALSLAAARLAAGVAPGQASGPVPALPWLAAALLLGLLALRLRPLVGKAGITLAGAALLALAPPRALPPPAPRIVALDVAQGEAVLIEAADAAVLVDGGAAGPGFDLGRQVVVPALRALGVGRLDLVVASHGDLDHRGGLVSVVEALAVGEVWLPPGGRADPVFAALRRAAGARRVPVREAAAGARWRTGDVGVAVLWPPPGARPRGRNDGSLVLRVAVAGRTVLLPGDIEQTAEQALLARAAPLSAEILKLPHHGSRSSSSPAFLRAVSPRVAIASAPCRGRWAMPHAEVRDRLRRLGAALWWTGRDGAVRVGLGTPLHVVGTGPARTCDPPGRTR